jgi:effector-binding domain-containing protein
MTSEIQLVDVPALRLLVKKTTCAHDAIGPTFGVAIHSVGKCMRASGGGMASMPMAVYVSWRASDCDLAAGCLVEGEVNLIEGCEWLDLPAHKAASASHYGPYSTLSETHHALMDWVKANGKHHAGPAREAYPTDPDTEPDSSKWRTDVFYPVSE